MSLMLKLTYIVLAIFFVWQLFLYLNRHPDALSKENIDKSIFTLGLLALGLMGFVYLLVYFLK